ncbi:MAG: hypothetical protein K6D95_09795 [Treponema sp.]|nr:hypothetical protein [Treponema sp.]
MKKISFTTILATAIIAISLSSCATTKASVGLDTKSTETNIVDWSNRNLDVEAKPEWLKKLVCGNSDIFKSEFGVQKDAIVKYGIATAKTRDTSLAASRVNYNAMRAEELKTKVVSEAASTLNDEGYTEATANAATLAKVDLSGHELVTQFWQKVEYLDKETEEKKIEFICYSVYQISKEAWLNTLKGYLSQVIPGIPDSKAQVKMANTIQSLYDDTAKEAEKSEADAKAAIQAQVDLARIEAEKEIAKAQASQPVVVQQAAPSQSNDSSINWADALELAAKVIF